MVKALSPIESEQARSPAKVELNKAGREIMSNNVASFNAL